MIECVPASYWPVGRGMQVTGEEPQEMRQGWGLFEIEGGCKYVCLYVCVARSGLPEADRERRFL